MKTSSHQVLITGGASGIGRALVEKFYKANNRVIAIGRNEEKLQNLQNEFPKVETMKADLAVKEDVRSIVAKYPDINILVNNAGIQENFEYANNEIDFEVTEKELNINLLSPLYLMKLYLPHLMRKEEAAIVNVSSGLALVPKQSAPVYCASKAALHLFSKALRRQTEGSSVKIFEILPPLVDTDMTKGRGKGKMSPRALADEFWKAFQKNKYEIYAGKTKLLRWINRISPSLAETILRKG